MPRPRISKETFDPERGLLVLWKVIRVGTSLGITLPAGWAKLFLDLEEPYVTVEPTPESDGFIIRAYRKEAEDVEADN